MDLLAQNTEHDPVIKLVETPGDVSLDKPGRPRPGDRHFGQGRMATTAATETVRAIGELRLVIRLKKQTDHLADEFVRPGRQAKRPEFPVLFLDIDPPYRAESVAFVAQRIDDAADLAQRHVVHGLPVGPGRHSSVVGVQPPVGQQIQVRVGQLPVQLVTRQATPAALTEDIQHRFGALHYACLPVPRYPVTWPPLPCGRLSRPPWWVVTPTTT